MENPVTTFSLGVTLTLDTFSKWSVVLTCGKASVTILVGIE